MTYLARLVLLLSLNANKVPDLAPKVGDVLHAPLVQILVVIKVESVFVVDHSLEFVHLSAFWVGMAPELDWVCDGVADHGRASG